MKCFLKMVHLMWFCLWVMLSGALFSCSETSPIGIPDEMALPETSTFTAPSNVRIRTARIEGAWDAPTVLATERVNGSVGSNAVSGPAFNLDQSGAMMAAWQATQYTDPPSGTPGRFKTTVVRRDVGSVQWVDNTPTPADNASNTTQPKIRMHDETGIAYATWYEFDTSTTFIRRYDPTSNSWGNLHSLKTSFAIQFFLDKQGSATIIWPSFTNSAYKLHVLRMSVDNDNLGAVSTLTRDLPGNATNGYVTNAGTTRVFWFEGGESLIPAQLWYADYTPATGWKEAQQISLGSLSIEFPLEKLTILYDESSQTTAITFSASLPADFNVSAYIYGLDNRNGEWTLPEPIDLNPKGSNFGVDSARNHSGQMTTVWSEVNADDAGTAVFYFVRVKQYSSQTGWGSTSTISDPLPLAVGNNAGIEMPSLYPQVAMNNQGEIAVAWLDINSQNNVDIFANYYLPNSGWGTQSLVAKTTLTSEYIQALDIQINDKGQTVIMWREIIRDSSGASHRMLLSQHNLGSGSIVSPPVNPEPLPTSPNPSVTPSLSFSEPVDVWNNAGQDNVAVNIHGPLISTSALTNEIYLTLINNRYYNSLNKQYREGENVILTQGVGANWTTIALPPGAKSAVDPAQLVFANDGTAFLIWHENRDLYLGTSKDREIWSTPILIDSNVGNAYLLPSANNMSIIWQPENDNSTIHLRHYLLGTDALAGLQNVNTLNFSDRQLLTSPISDAQGRVSVTWLSTNNSQEITISTIDLASQWQTSINTLGIGAPSKAKFQLAHGPDNTRILIAVSAGTNHLFASLYNEVDGWQEWQNIDQNQGTTDALMGFPQVRENESGQVMVLWIEKTLDPNGQQVHLLLSNIFAQINTDPSWSAPELIESTFHPGLGGSPILQFANDGSAMVAWIDNTITQQTLRYKQYASVGGWLDQTVDLVNYIDRSSGFMLNLNMVLTNTGRTLVTWQQLIGNNTGGEFHIWAIENNRAL